MLRIFVKGREQNLIINNVFDEMIWDGYAKMNDAEHLTIRGTDVVCLTFPVKKETSLIIGIIYNTEHKKLYIYGDAKMPENIAGMSYQEYFENKLIEHGITWEEVEDCKEIFICEEILGKWFESGKSSFSKNKLGELEVLDYLMPYEYCGKDNSQQKNITEVVEEGYKGSFEGKVEYVVWDSKDIRCMQVQQSRDYGYRNIIERIEADMTGFNTVSEKILVEWENIGGVISDDSLEDILGLDCNSFVKWLKTSGLVKGNLTKLSYKREEGEAKTLEMLENCPDNVLQRLLGVADFYIEGGELHIHLPYYDYEAKEEVWLRNGTGELWQGWISVTLEDIRKFLPQWVWR